MVSARPGPSPPKGRIAYPRADAYVPGDEDSSPSLSNPSAEPTSAQSFAAAHMRSTSPSSPPVDIKDKDKGKGKGKSTFRSGSPDSGPKAVGGLMRGLNLPLTGSAVHATPTLSGTGGPGMSYGLGSVVNDSGFIGPGAAGGLGGRGRSPSSPPAMQQSFPRHTGNAGISSPLSIDVKDDALNSALLGHSAIPEELTSAVSASAPGAALSKVKSIQIPVSALFANELNRQSSRGSDQFVKPKNKGILTPVSGTGGYMSESEADKDKDRTQTQGLKSWWKGFIEREKTTTTAGSGTDDERATKQRGAGSDEPVSSPGVSAGSGAGKGEEGGKKVFGVPLAESIDYASVQVSTVGEDGSLYVWGVIPVVVARCGLYLKETATEVEGAFRISGSAKRMRDLQEVFDTGPRYGKDIKWDDLGYTPHDVATIFRRFLTLAPESIIPTHLYEDFRAVLATSSTPPSPTETTSAIAAYKTLILSMPAVNQYLLLYVLDLLSVFARKSEINLMTTTNLAMIFQPGVLAHPVHAMRPREHVLSQRVLEFLIENQDEFLVGMELEKPKKRKSKRRIKADKEAQKAKEQKQKAAQLTKADPDLMPPSDSDDEAPTGGYYVIEGNPKVIAADNRQRAEQGQVQGQGEKNELQVPTQTVYDSAGKGKVPGSTSSLSRTLSPASVTGGAGTSPSIQSPASQRAPSSSIPDIPTISALSLAPPPPKPRVRSSSQTSSSAVPVQAKQIPAKQPSTSSADSKPPAPITARSPPTSANAALPTPKAVHEIQEEMEPSDSDEDVPGGTTYTVHVSEAAKAREAKANVKAGHGSGQQGRRLSLGGEGKGGMLGLGLGRKRTLGKGDAK